MRRSRARRNARNDRSSPGLQAGLQRLESRFVDIDEGDAGLLPGKSLDDGGADAAAASLTKTMRPASAG
jgi:hypothetical protein